DIIIRGGENVSAVEVEELLARLPGVAEVAVVSAPDARLGEHGCAFVRPQPGAPPLELAAARAHLEAAGLARPKWPEALRLVDELPRTPSGKGQKFALRERLRADAAAEAGPAVRGAGSAAQRRRLRGQVAEGRLTGTLALAEAGGRWTAGDAATVARPREGAWSLTGVKRWVADGATADEMVVAARLEGTS